MFGFSLFPVPAPLCRRVRVLGVEVLLARRRGDRVVCRSGQRVVVWRGVHGLWGRILRGRVGIVGRRVLCVVLRGAVAVVVEVGAFVGTVAIIATRIILRRGEIATVVVSAVVPALVPPVIPSLLSPSVLAIITTIITAVVTMCNPSSSLSLSRPLVPIVRHR